MYSESEYLMYKIFVDGIRIINVCSMACRIKTIFYLTMVVIPCLMIVGSFAYGNVDAEPFNNSSLISKRVGEKLFDLRFGRYIERSVMFSEIKLSQGWCEGGMEFVGSLDESFSLSPPYSDNNADKGYQYKSENSRYLDYPKLKLRLDLNWSWSSFLYGCLCGLIFIIFVFH